MSGLRNWSEYAVWMSQGISKFDRLTRIPDERREASTSCMVMEIISTMALRMVFAMDQLTPALRWSQTAKMQTIFMITAPGTWISVLIISWSSYLIKIISHLFEDWDLWEYLVPILRILDALAYVMWAVYPFFHALDELGCSPNCQVVENRCQL